MSLLDSIVTTDSVPAPANSPASSPSEPETTKKLATHEYIRTFALLGKAISDITEQYESLPRLGAQRAVEETLGRIIDILPAVKKHAERLRGAN